MPSFARAAADQDQYDEQARALGHRPAPNNKGYLPVRQQDRALTASRAEVNAAPVAEASVLSANTKRALVPLGALAVAVLTFAAQLMVLFETRYHFDWNAGQQGIYQEGGGEAFQHNLWASVGEMGKGGAGTLSFLVFALSGVLPYLTLALVVAVDWLGQGEAPASRAWKLLAVLSKWAFFEVSRGRVAGKAISSVCRLPYCASVASSGDLGRSGVFKVHVHPCVHCVTARCGWWRWRCSSCALT